MNRSLVGVSLFLGGVLSAFAQAPVIAPGGIVSNSSYIQAGLPGAAIAPNSIFTLFGQNIGPSAFTGYPGGSIPTTLGGTTVTFGSTPAPLYYVTATQIAGIVPSSVAAGAVQVTVTTAAGTSTVPVTVAANTFGITTLNGSGSGPGAIEDFSNGSAVIKLSAPAKPGDIGVAYGTGLGANPTGQDQTSAGAVPIPTAGGDLRGSLDFHVYVGGVEASVSYAGLSGYVGLDQINFVIPTNAPTGCYVPVIVRIGNFVSNSPSIAISSDGKTCSDPMGLNSQNIAQAESTGLKVGSLLLTRLSLSTNVSLGTTSLTETLTEDSSGAHFYDFNGTGSNSPDFNRSFVSLSSFGSCQVTYCGGTYTCVPSAQALSITGLDAGSGLTVGASGVPTVTLSETSKGNYSGPLASYPLQLSGFPSATDYLKPGTFTFAGTGGADVGAFSTGIAVPGVLSWNTSPAIVAGATINRNNPLAFTWTPTSNPKDYVLLSVSSATNVGTSSAPSYNSATVLCLQPASAGSYTIPSWILQALPASSTVNIATGISTLTGAVLAGVFDVTNTTTIPNVDLALSNSLVTSGIGVNIQ